MLGKDLRVEKESELLDSSLLTRARFLRTILSLRPHVVADLYNSSFAEFVFAVTHTFKADLGLPDSKHNLGVELFESLVEREIETIDEQNEPSNSFALSDSGRLKARALRPFITVQHLRGNISEPFLAEFACLPLMKSIARLMQLGDSQVSKAFSSFEHSKDKPESHFLSEALTQWSKRWNLDAEWCRDHALNVLRLWLQDEPLRWRFMHSLSKSAASNGRFAELWMFSTKEIEFDVGWSQVTLSDEVFGGNPREFVIKKLDFKEAGFNPIIQSPSEWRRPIELKFRLTLYKRELERLSQMGGNSLAGLSLDNRFTGEITTFRKRLSAHIKIANRKVAAAIKKYGLRKVQEMRKGEQHIAWTIRYQIPKNETLELELEDDIARSTNLSVPAISKATTKILKSVDLIKRAPQSGRKLGSKNHPAVKILRSLGN
jgi:hypothetical protein